MEERKISKAFGSVIIYGDSRGVCARGQGAGGARGGEQTAFSPHDNPSSSTFGALAEKNRGYKMSVEEAEEQRRSFVYGNCRFDNERVTREMVDQVADELAAVNETTVGNPSLMGAQGRVQGWRNESGLPVHLHWEAVGDDGDRLAVIKAVGATETTVGNPSLMGAQGRVQGWRNESGLPVHLHWEAVGDDGDRLAVIKAVGATERAH